VSPRRSVADAHQTHLAILDRAVDLASVQGLEGLTIGRLAHDLRMSKSGVLGHFGTKEELQLSALKAAADVFRREVWAPAVAVEAGLPRLLAVCTAWISYLERGVFPGGCFLTAASCEFDGRPGPVRDAVASVLELWWHTLESEVRSAQRAGQLPQGLDPRLAAFQLNAAAMATNQAIQLARDPQAGARGLAAMRAALSLSGHLS